MLRHKVRRNPHIAAQVVTVAIMAVLIRVLGQDAASNLYVYVIILAPVIAAKIGSHFTVPWREVLKWLHQMKMTGQTEEAEAYKALIEQQGIKLPKGI